MTQPAQPPPESDLSRQVYEHLHEIARRQMASERPGHTLTATALVHEAFLRLAPNGLAQAKDKAHFFNLAAVAMRRILIDHARGRATAKRGGGARRVTEIEGVADLARDDNPDDILALDEAISRLESEDPQCAAVLRLRFFAGLSGEEAAEALGISPRQADREWAYARVFLLKRLRGETGRE